MVQNQRVQDKSTRDESFQSWNSLMAETMAASGTEPFFQVLVEGVCRHVLVEHPQVWLYECGTPPLLLYHQFRADELDIHVNEYIRDQYRIDPFYCASLHPVEEGIYPLRSLKDRNFGCESYFHDYYSRMEVADEICHIVNVGPATSLNFSFMRRQSSDRFGPEDHDFLTHIEPLVRTLTRQHWEKYAAGRDRESQSPARGSSRTPSRHVALSHKFEQVIRSAMGSFGRSVLTEREQEVIRLSLMGHSIKTAAARLDISADTLKKHRRHIYEKLDISSNSELYAMFIQALPGYADLPDQDPFSLYEGRHDAPAPRRN